MNTEKNCLEDHYIEVNEAIPNVYTSAMGFYVNLFTEHLEEASFLYILRRHMINDGTASWKAPWEFEKRLEAHLSALALGGNTVLAICLNYAKEGDFSELYAVICVLCRMNCREIVNQVVNNIDFNDKEKIKALTDAFCHELPTAWEFSFINELFLNKDIFIIMACEIIVYRKIPFEERLAEILGYWQTDNMAEEPLKKEVVISLINALASCRGPLTVATLSNLLNNNDQDISSAAMWGLIKSRKFLLIKEMLVNGMDVIQLGLCGDENTFSEAEIIDTEDKNLVFAVGLAGSALSVPILIEKLTDELLAENASLALNLITGAELYEEHFIPEEIDTDILFDDEIEKYNRGELYPPGEEPGETILRISQAAETWEKWWNENSRDFDPGIRYRNGKPYSPQTLIENLKSETSPKIIRKLAFKELIIHYNVDILFNTDMFVKDQLRAITGMESDLNISEIQSKYWNKNIL